MSSLLSGRGEAEEHQARFDLILNKLTCYADIVKRQLVDQVVRYIESAPKLPHRMSQPSEECSQRRNLLFFEIINTEYEMDWVDLKVLSMVDLNVFSPGNELRLKLLAQGTEFRERLGVV
jgi:hypothetical protein